MSAPSASSYKGTAVFKRFTSFLGRLPKGEEGWNVELTSPDRVEHLRQRLTLPIAPHIRATLSWEGFFYACMDHVKSMGNIEDEAVFFKLVVLGASHVGMRETEADVDTGRITVDQGHRVRGVINNGTRSFLRCFGAKSEQFPDNNLIDYRRAVRLGIDLLRKLDEKRIGPRAYEIPLYVRYILSTFFSLSWSDKFLAFFDEAMPGIYRPQAQWDSEMLSIPNLVHDNLGGRLSRLRVHQLLGVPLRVHGGRDTFFHESLFPTE